MRIGVISVETSPGCDALNAHMNQDGVTNADDATLLAAYIGSHNLGNGLRQAYT
jgi:hypothetical protein